MFQFYNRPTSKKAQWKIVNISSLLVIFREYIIKISHKNYLPLAEHHNHVAINKSFMKKLINE